MEGLKISPLEIRQSFICYPTLIDIEIWQIITALGIKPYKDGNQWCYLYGDDIQSGICGFGNTIKEAAFDFYINLTTKSED